MTSHRQSFLRPATQEEVGHWVRSNTEILQEQDKQRVSQTPASGLCKLMGLVGRCGSVVHASPQGEGSRKLFLSI